MSLTRTGKATARGGLLWGRDRPADSRARHPAQALAGWGPVRFRVLCAVSLRQELLLAEAEAKAGNAHPRLPSAGMHTVLFPPLRQLSLSFLCPCVYVLSLADLFFFFFFLNSAFASLVLCSRGCVWVSPGVLKHGSVSLGPSFSVFSFSPSPASSLCLSVCVSLSCSTYLPPSPPACHMPSRSGFLVPRVCP